jgi:SepF-like predicted cell division protein (DUF552 family)
MCESQPSHTQALYKSNLRFQNERKMKMRGQKKVTDRLDRMEDQLREIFDRINRPSEQMTLMQVRVAAYKKIKFAVEQIDRLLETVETEFVTLEEEVSSGNIVFLNKQQEQEHNEELNHIVEQLREIRWTLISSPENQNFEESRAS